MKALFCLVHLDGGLMYVEVREVQMKFLKNYIHQLLKDQPLVA